VALVAGSALIAAQQFLAGDVGQVQVEKYQVRTVFGGRGSSRGNRRGMAGMRDVDGPAA